MRALNMRGITLLASGCSSEHTHTHTIREHKSRERLSPFCSSALLANGGADLTAAAAAGPIRTHAAGLRRVRDLTERGAGPHNMDYNPTRWTQSPRIVMKCAP